jgi:ribosomal protein S4
MTCEGPHRLWRVAFPEGERPRWSELERRYRTVSSPTVATTSTATDDSSVTGIKPGIARRQLLVRYERTTDIHKAFLSLACCLICRRRLQNSVCRSS